MKKIILAPLLLLFSCINKNNASSDASAMLCDDVTVQQLKDEVLGANLNTLPVFDCYAVKDSLLEGDEGLSWNGKSYYYEGRLIFLAESNWENPQKVHRVTILDPMIKEGNLFVGQSFGKMKDLVSDSIPTAPDGYLFLQYKKNRNVQIQLHIPEADLDKPVFYGIREIGAIPPGYKVEAIIIM